MAKMNNHQQNLIAFALFLFQSSTVVLLIRYSRIKYEERAQYANSSIIGSAEIGKIIVGLICTVYHYTVTEKQSVSNALSNTYIDIFGNGHTLCLMSVPSLCYNLQNVFMYTALSRIDTSLYQIIVQLKTFTTAVFGMCILSKSYTRVQWLSFLLLSVGVAVANLSVLQHDASNDTQLVGILCVLASTVTSGFAGTFMELQLKSNRPRNTIFIQNIQLSMFALLGCVLNAYLTNELTQMLLYGVWYGFNRIVCVIVVLNIFGGYFVALVIQRASTMIKTFLSGITTLLVIAESYLFLGDQQIVRSEFLCAVLLVLAANYLYNKEKQKQKQQALLMTAT